LGDTANAHALPVAPGLALGQDEIGAINEFEGFLSFQKSWWFDVFVRLDHQFVALFCGNQSGKCLEKNTIVSLSDGRSLPIKDVSPGDRVITIGDDLRQRERVVLDRIDSGEKECVLVKTQGGGTIVCTPEHPFLTPSGWSKIQTIGVGGYVAVPRTLPFGVKNCEEWEPKLAGYLVGDGGISNGSIHFSNIDESALKEVMEIVSPHCRMVFDGRCTWRISGKPGGKNFLIEWLRNIDQWGKTAWFKTVPQFVLSGDEKTVADFISRLFSCDAHVSDHAIEYTTVSEELAQGVRLLLMKFGIVPKVGKRKTSWAYKGIRKSSFAYTVIVSRSRDVDVFSQKIGIYTKNMALHALVELQRSKTTKENRDTVPVDIKHLYPRSGGYKTSRFELLRSARGKTITREKLKSIGEAFSVSRFVDLATSDIYWDKVVSVDNVGVHQTYDLTIDGTHNFVAAGFYAHNTGSTMYQYVLRALGLHPHPRKNVLVFECACGRAYFDSVLRALVTDARDQENLRPEDNICTKCGQHLTIRQRRTHTFRLFAENLPTDSDSTGGGGDGEIRNSTYPALKRWLPAFLVKKDITSRSPSLKIKNINSKHWFGDLYYDGDDIIFEFMSYGQSTQAGAGVQRLSVYSDEEMPRDVFSEQVPRLLAEDGDFIMGLTPAQGLSWTFDDIFERAAVYIRSQAVRDFMTKENGKAVQPVVFTGSTADIAVIQTATDDNPTLDKSAIDRLFAMIDDPEELATRRYGIHKQTSGRIFKDFNPTIHVIDPERYFDEHDCTPPHTFRHIRAIDYHTHNPWAVTWVALSPQDELFVYHEWAPSPDKFVTRAIAERIANMSKDRRFDFNLIDPLANSVQTNTGTTTVQDLNREFHALRNNGVGMGGFWEGWDTKSTRGRDKIRERLKNSLKAGQPFNNEYASNDGIGYMPTIWFFNTTVEMIRSMRQWRLETWSTQTRAAINKDKKESPAQRYSHFPMCLEGILKDTRLRPPAVRDVPIQNRTPKYMKRP